MKENTVITLYRVENKGDLFIFRAYLLDGALRLEGQDFSETAARMFGDEDYEYFYSFSLEATNKLLSILGGDNISNAINKFFNGKMANAEFFKLCDDNKIGYDFHSC